MTNEKDWGMPTPEEMNKESVKVGGEIYLSLREKYRRNDLHSFDQMFNIFAYCLVALRNNHVKPERHADFIKMIEEVLNRNPMTKAAQKEVDDIDER